jgi:uncharacterized protein (TIGR01244 family)
MTEFRTVTSTFAVAPQLQVADFARAAAEGFRVVVKNRPEGEEPGQPSDAEMKAAAEAAGLEFHALPYAGGPPPPRVVADTAALLERSPGPVLAYCRSGTRSVTAWALAQALLGERRADEIIALAAKAGYDLSGVRGVLEQLSPNP